jgi:hypothetical protein
LPAILEAEDRSLRGHDVKQETGLRLLEATDHAALYIVFESSLSDPLLESVVVPGGRDLDDHVDVVGRSEFRCRVIGDPQLNRRAADEDNLLE